MLQWLEREMGDCSHLSRLENSTYEGSNSYPENTPTAVERFFHVTRNSSYARRNPGLWFRGKSLYRFSFMQLFGAGCLVMIALCFRVCIWGLDHHAGHYPGGVAVALAGLTLFPLGYVLHAFFRSPKLVNWRKISVTLTDQTSVSFLWT